MEGRGGQFRCVQIDGHEIHEYRWLRPADALSAQAAGTMRLAAPTFALTTRLATYANVGAALTAVREWPQERLLGCLHDVPGGCVAIYEQDEKKLKAEAVKKTTKQK